MTNPWTQLRKALVEAMRQTTGLAIEPTHVTWTPAPPHVDADYAIAVFAYAKTLKQDPQALSEALGVYLRKHAADWVAHYQGTRGFLNLKLTNAFWSAVCADWDQQPHALLLPKNQRKRIVLEYCSPNTNKPLHLGHLRNLFLGYALQRLLNAVGHRIYAVCLLNDRGMPICQSMAAYLHEGKNDTPNKRGIKGDHFVGHYYVRYHQLREQIPQIEKQAATLLQKWEKGDHKVRQLWQQLNEWVEEGFEQSYARLNINFDAVYKESETYTLGKEMVHKGLEKGLFYKDKAGAVWVDLTQENLDKKVLLRADGTSVYITQDIGTHFLKRKDYPFDHSLYVVGNEQLHHFKVLFSLISRLGEPNNSEHIAYGMVELPSGRMKSREGQVVDADELMDEMVRVARSKTEASNKLMDMKASARETLYQKLGLGALRYYLLRVGARKNILFDPDKSIDFEGMTATFIQYTYARIQSLIGRAKAQHLVPAFETQTEPHVWSRDERSLLRALARYNETLHKSANSYDPSVWAMYVYELARAYNHYYGGARILDAASPVSTQRRLYVSARVGVCLKAGMALLGIEVPQRM